MLQETVALSVHHLARLLDLAFLRLWVVDCINHRKILLISGEIRRIYLFKVKNHDFSAVFPQMGGFLTLYRSHLIKS